MNIEVISDLLKIQFRDMMLPDGFLLVLSII